MAELKVTLKATPAPVPPLPDWATQIKLDRVYLDYQGTTWELGSHGNAVALDGARVRAVVVEDLSRGSKRSATVGADGSFDVSCPASELKWGDRLRVTFLGADGRAVSCELKATSYTSSSGQPTGGGFSLAEHRAVLVAAPN